MGRAPYGYRHELQTDEHGKRRSVLVPREDEDPQAVVAAFVVAGTYNGAAMLLSGPAGQPLTYDDGSPIGLGVGLPTRFGKGWDASTVRHVVMREAPTLVPVTAHKGSPARKSTHMFARLLRCPHAELHGLDKDGNPSRPYLTVSAAPTYVNKQGETHTYPSSYYCAVAHVQSREVHPRPYMVSAAKILAWAKEETKDISRRVERERKGKSPDPEAKLAEMEARKAGIGDAYAAGAYGPAGSPQAKAAMAQRLAAIDAEMPVLEAGRRAMAVGLQPVSMSNLPPPGRPFDWTRDPAAINADLRNLWQRVELDPATMLPKHAVWTIGKDPVEDAAIEAAEEAEYEPQGETPRARIADAVRWYRATEPARQAELERLRAQLRSEGKME